MWDKKIPHQNSNNTRVINLDIPILIFYNIRGAQMVPNIEITQIYLGTLLCKYIKKSNYFFHF